MQHATCRRAQLSPCDYSYKLVPSLQYMASLIGMRQLVCMYVPCQGRIAQLRRAHAGSELVYTLTLVYQVLTREGDLARQVPVAAWLVDAMMVAGMGGIWGQRVLSRSRRVRGSRFFYSARQYNVGRRG
jgi:hypothetical protein